MLRFSCSVNNTNTIADMAKNCGHSTPLSTKRFVSKQDWVCFKDAKIDTLCFKTS